MARERARHRKCPECGKARGSNPDHCEVCWHEAMEQLVERDQLLSNIDIDAVRGKS